MLRYYLLNISLLISSVNNYVYAREAPISNLENRSINHQITQIERILNAHGQLLTELQQQIYVCQKDIDLLRNQVQENQHYVLQTIEKQNHVYQRINSIFNDPQIAFNTNKSSMNNDNLHIASSENKKNADNEYKKAVTLALKKKYYNEAINAFHKFIKCYPQSTHQANAHYWLGQINYNQGKKDNATYYFAIVVKKYPNSIKAPESLYKIGLIMQEKGYKDKAKAIYQQIGKLYPKSEIAKQAQKRLAKYFN